MASESRRRLTSTSGQRSGAREVCAERASGGAHEKRRYSHGRVPVRMGTAANICAGPFGVLYDFYIERPWLMQLIGRAVWGINASVLYAAMEDIAGADGGSTVVDIPCGGGVAFRALRPGQNIRYIAGDLDDRMLERARRRARSRALDYVEVTAADMTDLPLADNSANLFVSFSGLHMVNEPERAVQEIARCLKPGGTLIGTTFLREGSRRQRTLFRAGVPRGHPEPPRYEDLRDALNVAGMTGLVIEPQRGFAAFRARKQSLDGSKAP